MSRSKKHLNRIPSPAMACAVLALVAACAGTAVALPGKKTVDRNDLRKNVVSGKNVTDGGLTGADVADGSVSASDLADGSVAAAEIADGSVGTAELADASVGTSELADGSVTQAKLAASARSAVVAFGRVRNPTPGNPTLTDAVGIQSVSLLGADNEGNTRLTIAEGVIPNGKAEDCAITTQMIDPDADPNASLGFPGFVTVATGSPLSARQIQVQTRSDNGGLADRDYFIQVTCPQA